MSEFLREAIRLYMDEREWLRRERRERAEGPPRRTGVSEEDAPMNQQTDYKGPRPSTPGSPATVRTWTCPSPHSYERLETTHRRRATWSPASMWTRPRADASPTAPNSAR